MFDLRPESLHYWYKRYLSDYFDDIEKKQWHPQKIATIDKSTGELIPKPVYVFKKENIAENMSIDDKAIGHDGFTVLSNHQTGKIALLIESTKAEEVEAAIELFGDDLKKVKNISMDMSATYALVAGNLMPQAKQIIDKYHVMKHVYDAVGDVRKDIRKSLAANLTKGKKKTAEDKKILSDIELVRRVRHAITQSPDKWNPEMKQTINQVFEKHDDLKRAYLISQEFKHWYNYKMNTKSIEMITETLHKWYEKAKQMTEFESVIKMIRKHEDKIINFFRNGMTNAKAERLNGKIQRFVSGNYGLKDKDFFLYRMAGYFS